MGLFDGFDPQDFADRGGLLGRLLSLRPDLAAGQVGANQLAQGQAAQASAPEPNNILASQSATPVIGSALDDFYRQTILKPGSDIAGYVNDAINDPAYFIRAIGPSLAGFGPIVGELPTAARGISGALRILRPAAESNPGDLTESDNFGSQYHDRVRQRALEDPVGHNFPSSYDSEILASEPIPRPDYYTIFRKSGSLNGNDGVFEIGVNKDGIIDHRVFRRNK
jgi:hypothetical protein